MRSRLLSKSNEDEIRKATTKKISIGYNGVGKLIEELIDPMANDNNSRDTSNIMLKKIPVKKRLKILW